MDKHRIVVIGAGIAGLSAALDLAGEGYDVVVCEAAGEPGGKMRQVELAGMRVDSGPTVFTMRWVFDELFAAAGTSLEAQVTMAPLEILARHAWQDGERLDLFADIERSVDAIGQSFGRAEAEGYRNFCRDAGRVYRTLEQTFIKSERPSVTQLISGFGLSGVGELLKAHPFESMWSELGKYFKDPKLQQLFGRYATYCGSSPFEAPATLTLVAHVEQQGVWRIAGGLQSLAFAIETLAKSKGANFRYGAKVERIIVERGKVSGVRLASGEVIAAAAVISNADVNALASGHFGPDTRGASELVAATERSLSAMTWALVAETEGFPLLHHTVFFSSNYRAEFDDILRAGRVPHEPTIYVCAEDRADDKILEPGRSERLLLIVNAPARGDALTPQQWETDQCEQRTFGRLERLGLKIRRSPEQTLVRTPGDYEQLFPGTGGALYGRASHGWAASFKRAGCSTKIPGLYLASGSVHPGPGVPLSALSGRHAARRIVKDFNSRGRFRPAAMLGGMSMH